MFFGPTMCFGKGFRFVVWAYFATKPGPHQKNMRYRPIGKLRWLDIGRVLFCVFVDLNEVGVQ